MRTLKQVLWTFILSLGLGLTMGFGSAPVGASGPGYGDHKVQSRDGRRPPPVRPAPPRRPPPMRPAPPRRPPPYRPAPPPPRRPPPPRYPPPNVPIICYADDGHPQGYTYWARGYDYYAVQNEAMRQCYMYSYNCYERGCERDY